MKIEVIIEVRLNGKKYDRVTLEPNNQFHYTLLPNGWEIQTRVGASQRQMDSGVARA